MGLEWDVISVFKSLKTNEGVWRQDVVVHEMNDILHSTTLRSGFRLRLRLTARRGAKNVHLRVQVLDCVFMQEAPFKHK